METKIGTTIEISAVRKDGNEFPIELALSSWESDNQKFYTGIIRDISERKTAELEITEALSSAEAANKVKDQFIANISHEIRTPLNSILGFSDLLEKRLKETISNQDHQLFGYIAKSSNRLMKTVDFILNNSQLQAGTIKIQPQELNLSTILKHLFNEFKPFADEKSLEFELLNADHSMLIFGDEYYIRQAISNIIENALKYTFEGSVKLSLGSRSGQLSLSITDTGIGISEAYQERIFDAYTQESEGFTKDYQGIGLGLALTKQYLDLNNVALEIESKKDVGSTFTLIFPINKGGNNV
ncbi:MAG: HAMP domain-containing histidine kinase [Candidatus Marinimicrobia bacterium]|nr:HAMP domain-containing histidine kinase [Candidatus Neomarinimicrobiota bacterium]MBT3680300.1 HAMP domain-containing histidine kinase [Candidatus Neomarinimicrobiota bacterium]MBT3950413.1 HAMP domain-containing histidine kinase [Candidatus Neomarinimicrobiota bacterium]MBT4254046.1 HAMP domain-containing histidine kinase [Candidatus Neomarinimicrobiota bacterium]MBT4480110.1 HAMP domain-containing histidine kinase [Candidatus Neomarinimicrobiota bacterium]